MREDTRQQMLDTAKRLFAGKGFYGASLANIAEELQLTKQALLHHFGNKEKLYGAILQQISDRMLRTLCDAREQYDGANQQLEQAFLGLYALSLEHPHDIQIIIRELVDSERRAEEVHSWYLKPFLDTLVEMIRDVSGDRRLAPRRALAQVYPILGGMNFLLVSEVVLTKMYGANTYRHMQSTYNDQLREQVRALIEAL